jgi:predicted metalloprotease with PDZ domain
MKTRLRRLIILLAVIVTLSSAAAAQELPLKSIAYRLAMSRPVSHLFEVAIEVELPDELKDQPLQFQMPKWSPGRYAVFDFAKNVQEFRAIDGRCSTVIACTDKPARTVTRADDQTWSVASAGSSTRRSSRQLQRRLHLHVRRGP